jgi:hypothetical protein
MAVLVLIILLSIFVFGIGASSFKSCRTCGYKFSSRARCCPVCGDPR